MARIARPQATRGDLDHRRAGQRAILADQLGLAGIVDAADRRLAAQVGRVDRRAGIRATRAATAAIGTTSRVNIVSQNFIRHLRIQNACAARLIHAGRAVSHALVRACSGSRSVRRTR